MEGWYRLFWNQGVKTEFTDIEHLDQEDVPVMVLPSILSISGEMADQLTEFVEQGGLLLSLIHIYFLRAVPEDYHGQCQDAELEQHLPDCCLLYTSSSSVGLQILKNFIEIN